MKRLFGKTEPASTKTTITKALIDELKRAADERKAAGAKGERQVFRDDKSTGLLLRVNADGTMGWYLDYRSPTVGRTSYKIGDALRMDPGDARKELKRLGPDPAADRKAQRAALDMQRVETARADARTLRKFLAGDYWDRHLKLAPSGLATQKRVLAAWAPLLDLDMQAITVETVLKHRAKRLAAGTNPRTLNRDRIALMAALNKAVQWGLMDRNPIDTPAFKPLATVAANDEDDSDTDDGKRVRWLGKRDDLEDIRNEAGQKLGERQRFMSALAHSATPAYLRDLCIVAMNTGLRRGELFKLQWSRVSITGAQLTVAAATSRKSKKQRHVALNTVALEVFTRLWAAREEATREAKAAGSPIKLSPFVFVNADTGKPFTTLKKSWAVLAARARLEDFTFHDLRHDFASRLVQAGVNLYEVKDLLGHSSITLTERYAHLAPHHKRAAVAVLEA